MFKKLLVPLDRSSFAEQALGPAVGIARASGAKLVLMMVHVPRPLAGALDVEWHASQLPREDKYLAGIAERVTETTGISTSHVVASGDVVPTICDQALRENADLVVMTSHARTGFGRAWIGSIADGVIRESPLPVLMIRPRPDDTRAHSFAETLQAGSTHDGFAFRRILVPLDGSILAREVLPAAAALAQCAGGHLVLLQVVEPIPSYTPQMGISSGFAPPVPSALSTGDLVQIAEQSMTATVSGLMGEGCEDVETRVLVAPDAGHAIVHFALDNAIDVIAMSTHGRGVSRLLVGSVADKVLRASVVPMLLRRPAAKSATRTTERERAETAQPSTITVI